METTSVFGVFYYLLVQFFHLYFFVIFKLVISLLWAKSIETDTHVFFPDN